MDHNLSVIQMHYKKHHSLVNVTRKGNNNRIWFLYNSKATRTLSVFSHLCTLELKIRCSGTKSVVKGNESSAGKQWVCVKGWVTNLHRSGRRRGLRYWLLLSEKQLPDYFQCLKKVFFECMQVRCQILQVLLSRIDDRADLIFLPPLLGKKLKKECKNTSTQEGHMKELLSLRKMNICSMF